MTWNCWLKSDPVYGLPVRMLRKLLCCSLLAGMPVLLHAQDASGDSVNADPVENLTIQYNGQDYTLEGTGINSDGDYARYFLPGESVNDYTVKLATVLNRFVIGDDPIEEARNAAEVMQESEQVVFSELLTNKQTNQAIFIFGYRYPDGEYQLNLWKYEKRPGGVFRSQVMIAAPEGVDNTAFKLWTESQRDSLLAELVKGEWPTAENQKPYDN